MIVGQCSPTFTRCTFENNEAPNKGGAAFMWGNAASPQVVGCTFSENRVLNSGGIGGAVVVENGCPATLRDCTFTANEAVSNGGGVAVTGSTSHAKLVQCSLTGNDAPSGGGLSVASGQVTAVNCRFLGNQGQFGGGVFVQGGNKSGSADLTNCVFSGNVASDDSTALGGGLCVVGSGTADVTNCTFSGNTATAEEDALGGGVYVEGATATIKNTIAWGNLVNGLNTELGQIHKWSFSTFSLWFSCVQNWTSGGLGGSYNTASDPLLADPDGVDNALGTADDDVRLTADSTAVIDTASDAAVPEDDFDLDRNGDTSEPLPLDLGRGDRFLGTGPTVDMGAYEYLNPGDGLGDPAPPAAGAPAPEPSGTADIAFAYDALGRRIERIVDSGGANVEVTRYYWDGQNTVLEVDADEAPRRTYVHGSQYIDERVLMRLPNGQEYYYLPRELYSVAALTDETGSIVEAATYDTYGKVAVYDESATAIPQSEIGNVYYFTGRRLGLLPVAGGLKQAYHYRAREYDPGNGRFLQRDPLGYGDGTSLYEYVRSMPTTQGEHDQPFHYAARLIDNEFEADDFMVAPADDRQAVRNQQKGNPNSHRAANDPRGDDLCPRSRMSDTAVVLFQGSGSAWCDTASGQPKSTVKEHCAGNCVKQHEDKHKSDLVSCCSRYAKCLRKHPSSACDARWTSWLNTNRSWLECRAYGRERECLKSVIFWGCDVAKSISCGCCNTLRGEARFAKQQRNTECAASHGRARCPFDDSGNIRTKVIIGVLPP